MLAIHYLHPLKLVGWSTVTQESLSLSSETFLNTTWAPGIIEAALPRRTAIACNPDRIRTSEPPATFSIVGPTLIRHWFALTSGAP